MDAHAFARSLLFSDDDERLLTYVPTAGGQPMPALLTPYNRMLYAVDDKPVQRLSLLLHVDAAGTPGVGKRTLFVTNVYVDVDDAGMVRNVEVSFLRAKDATRSGRWVDVPRANYSLARGARAYAGFARALATEMERWAASDAALPALLACAEKAVEQVVRGASDEKLQAENWGRIAEGSDTPDQTRHVATLSAQLARKHMTRLREVETYLRGLVVMWAPRVNSDATQEERERLAVLALEASARAEAARTEAALKDAETKRRAAERIEQQRREREAKERLEAAAAPALLAALEGLLPHAGRDPEANDDVIAAWAAARAAIAAAKEGDR
jgi:hypothetical protein